MSNEEKILEALRDLKKGQEDIWNELIGEPKLNRIGLIKQVAKNTDDISKLKNVNIKIMAVVTAAIWLIGTFLKWLVTKLSFGALLIK